MSKQDYPYPDDEFDARGATRSPRGVHREPVPAWKQWLPYLLVLILVPLLTVGVVKYFAGPQGEETPEASPTESVEPTEEPSDDQDPSDDDADAAGDDDAQTPEDPTLDEGDADADDDVAPDAELDHGVHVLVLNGAGINGLAGQMTDLLADDGWVNTEAETYTGTATAVTTVYYTSQEFAAEAEQVAGVLGIDNRVESSSAATNGIVVVLRADFAVPTP